ncbi:hypothetical protein OG413_40515 [Streptomyces sp. NBC_01433]|uniref:hypothetical protein n=1 Tax=Streptomyces sp. NBC_01433 TaxID=2903864 RepID=UPI00225A4D03|nr:hypothetical protein [Streptomyces sp. NBC_01433]MCX4681485.1 hypothetical protein [Streptomyces sp. NBC_01433]
MTRSGSAITFLGPDGAGKSTIARAVRQRLADDGRPVRILSRRDYLRAQPTGHVADTNRALYDAGLRSLYSLAEAAHGTALGTLLPAPPADLRDSALEKRLDAAPIATNDAQAITAAALCEIAGSLFYYASVIHPELEQGMIVIEETHPLKMVSKLCLLAQRTARHDSHARAAATVLRSAAMVLRPNEARAVPVLVRCSPHRAYDRLIAQRGALGGLEHHGAAGSGRGKDAYLDLQTRLMEALEEVAAPWRCVVVSSDEEDQDSSVKRAVDAILADPRMAHLA